MDIYTYLITDHRKVAALIEQVLEINLQTVQQRTFEDIKAELTLHAAAEEQTFYAALRNAAPDSEQNWTFDRADADHDDIRALLEELTHEAITSPKWMMTFGQLKYAVEHHVEDEENHVFALARTVLSQEEAEQLPAAMEACKRDLKSRLGIRTDHIADA